MHKEEILKRLRDAKSAHTKWVLRAQMLVKGLTLNEDAIPVSYTDCQFGKWLYSDAQKLTVMPELKEIIKKIMKYHKDLHDKYLEIFEIYFKNKNFLSKLFNIKTPRKVTIAEAQKAKKNFEEIEEISEKLLEELEKLELRILAIKNDKINEMML